MTQINLFANKSSFQIDMKKLRDYILSVYIDCSAIWRKSYHKLTHPESELSMQSNLSELNSAEISAVSGGVIFLAPVVVKIAAWGLGAAFGVGVVVVAKNLLN